MTRKAEAYKSGDIDAGNWTWAVGVPDSNGRHKQIAPMNSTACWRLKVDPQRVAEIMAAAFNREYPS